MRGSTSAALAPPRVTIVADGRIRLSIHAGVDAVYVTDEEGTILAYDTVEKQSLEVELEIAQGAASRSLVGVAHDRHSCVTVRSEAVPTWPTLLEEFNYEKSGGLSEAAAAAAGWTEANLSLSDPRLFLPGSSKLRDGTARGSVHLQQQPSLFAPLLHVKCDGRAAPLLLVTFTAAEWPRGHSREWSSSFAVPRDCLRLRACVALPAGPAGCGGHPERCGELDLLPHLALEIEAVHPPRPTPPFPPLSEPLSEGGVTREDPRPPSDEPAATHARGGAAPALVARRASAFAVTIRSEVCGTPPAVLYVRGGAADGPVLGFAAGGGGTLRVPLLDKNATGGHAMHGAQAATPGGGAMPGGSAQHAQHAQHAQPAQGSLFVYSLCGDETLRVTIVAVSELPPPQPPRLPQPVLAVHRNGISAATSRAPLPTWAAPHPAAVAGADWRGPRRQHKAGAVSLESLLDASLPLLFALSCAATLVVGGVVALLAAWSCWARRHYRQLTTAG